MITSKNETLTRSPRTRGTALLWSGGAAMLLAGFAAGYLLPSGGSSSIETDDAPLVVASADAINPGAAASPTARAPGGPWPTHEFSLSSADMRDSQEAPALAIDAQDRICLAWASKTAADERTLYVATSDDGGKTFRGPRIVRKSGIFKSSSKGKGGGFERRLVPLLTAYGDTILLAWGEAPADGSTIRMMLAESRDGGESFGAPVCVHQSGDARPTFNSLAVNRRGKTVCAWLDGRNGAQHLFAAIRDAGDGPFRVERRLYAGPDDSGVCPCCLTSAAVAEDGAVVVGFRNQLGGYRDIWVSKVPSSDEPAGPATPLAAPRWQFEGCPHDGPSLEICGGQLHVAWMDAQSGVQRAYYGRAPLGAAPLENLQFEIAPLHALGSGTQGNAKLRADPAGRLHAVWEESIADEPTADKDGNESGQGHLHGPPTGTGRVIVHAFSERADGRFSAPHPIAPMTKRFQTRPALACSTAGVFVAWNELDESGKRVVVTHLADTESAESYTTD